ncbi:MAG: DUF2961 domain-containing protein [Thermoguttaceae bacterium]|nr:DUF2961 domain-containing protein [Thermoguttaceae bacterium]MDW8080199.1 glycoside hydrolase family 172 protein [Thermoguttaceae bacterium]
MARAFPDSLRTTSLVLALVPLLIAGQADAQYVFDDLPRLLPGRTISENALWIENPLHRQFREAKQVVVAEVDGPGIITMIHFALPQRMVAKPEEYRLGRELTLRIFWDGEESPSVLCPLVDFFCDPAGEREKLETALVNKKRGWNAYFPMPFRRSVRVELVYEGPVPPGQELWELMPCYSYVIVRQGIPIPADWGYFHAAWRQALVNMGKEDFVALEATGQGKFIGWNVTIRLPGRPGYPVDENAKFFVDGQEVATVELQGIEDAFGFSWGFPSEENTFLLTGFFPFQKEGAAAYRFFLGDAISFERSLRVTIGFGEREDPMFRRQFGKPGNELELSATVYWYQREPHAALPELPPAEKRKPTHFSWKEREQLPTPAELERSGVKLHFRCGRPEQELIYAQPGYSATILRGFSYIGWPFPMFHTRADQQEIQLAIKLPPGRSGILRLFMIDPDRFQGGRHQEILVNDKSVAQVKDFEDGRQLEIPVDASLTQNGQILLRIVNLNPASNAVISVVEWVEPAP